MSTERTGWRAARGTGRRRLVIAAGAAVLLLGVVALAVADGPSEVEQLTAVLNLSPGATVADIGAGDGWLSIAVARDIGPTGHVFATELNPARRNTIRQAVADVALDHVTVVEAGVNETNLPAGCCDAIFMRRVYHHLTDSASINASLHRAIKPGGRLAIIEMEMTGLLSPFKVWPHWTDDAQVVAEVTDAGFTHVRTEDWPGAGHYVAVFRK